MLIVILYTFKEIASFLGNLIRILYL